MYFFTFLAAFLLLKRLRKSLETSPLYTKWNKILNYCTWITIGVFLIVASLLDDMPADILSLLYLAGVMAFFYKEPDFKEAHPLLKALYPFIAICVAGGLVKLISPAFYTRRESYFDMAIIAGFVWIFAIWVNYNKQQKALEYERQQRQSEEQQKQIITTQKDELEVLVTERTAEITKQKNELQQIVNELKTTQTQLIQSEKMASLGELTAGIAHEIQNPLNFVNNFSEVNKELADELEEEAAKGNMDEVKAIAKNIKENEQKINFHGKRADAIVKGMLQHSRANTGKKEPTDINALADEYLRLSYHGLRAKDKSFNADFTTDFDESIGKINLVPQDIGRVLLNLFNNSFYAVAEKKKQQALPHFQNVARQEPYEPIVSVSTKKLNGGLEISVKDNGVGISQKAVDKIFQPFFTTKPTGQGTGLGLSLSYDIIKAHGGEIKVETKEDKGSKFIIELPIA